MSEPIKTERRDKVLEVTIDRPKANAIDAQTSRIMGDTFASFRDDDSYRDRLAMEADLRGALERLEFELHYQPRLDIQTCEILGCEALIRWNHPERGRVSPGQFIPIAEETGLISEIGRQVLTRSCQDAAGWPDDGQTIVTVNLSARQFRGESRPGISLRRAGLPARRGRRCVRDATARTGSYP